MSSVQHVTYLSLGAGVQSSALYVMITLGMCVRADVAIFADTQSEPHWVYEQLEVLRKWGEENDGPKIVTVTAGNLGRDVVDRNSGKRAAAIPVFTKGKDGESAPLRRQCTREYKIEPIEKYVRRELLGIGYRKRIGNKTATALIGISVDEIRRVKPNPKIWVTNEWPLVDLRMRRHNCSELLEEHGLPVPNKSACVFCPYHDDRHWIDVRDKHPEEFAKAVEWDKQFRDMRKSGIKQPVFLHRSLVPLDEVHFKGDGQLSLWDDECEGMCGV